MIGHLVQLLPLLLQGFRRRTQVEIPPPAPMQIIVVAERETQKVHGLHFFDSGWKGLWRLCPRRLIAAAAIHRNRVGRKPSSKQRRAKPGWELAGPIDDLAPLSVQHYGRCGSPPAVIVDSDEIHFANGAAEVRDARLVDAAQD